MVCAQLRLVLWKNWILKKRRCMGTLIEIAVPVLAIALLILLRNLIKVEDQPQNLLINQARTVDEDAFNLVIDAGCGYKVHRPLQRWQFPFDGDAPNKFLWKFNHIAFAPARDDAQLRFDVDALMTGVRRELLSWAPVWPTHVNCTFPCNDFPWSVLFNNYTCPTNEYFEVDSYLRNDLFRLFPTAESLESYMQSSDYDSKPTTSGQRTIYAAVIVDSTGDNWDYTLRTNWTDEPYTGQSKNTLEVGFEETKWAQYYEDHLIYLKHVIDRYIITKQSKVVAPGMVSFLPFPIPAHKKDNFRDVMGNVAGLFLIMSFMWPFSRLVRNLVEEKERKIKEGMKMMGLANSMYWASWALTYLVMFTIMAIAATAISKPSLFRYSDPTLIFLFFFSFSLSLITAACLMTTFFARAKTAGTLSPFLLFLAFLPFFSVSDPQGPTGTKNLASLLSPVAMALGTSNILNWESAFIGTQWNNVGQDTENYKMSDAIFLMFFDALLYGFISWYVDHVIPKEYGTNKPWYFLCTCKYWRSCCPAPKANIPDLPDGNGITSSSSVNDTNTRGGRPTMAEIKSQMKSPLLNPAIKEASAPDFGPDYEAVPDEMEANIGVITRKLRKVYTVPDKPEPFVAVDSLDMNLYTGQIFVLLGHNGAGKSTTINMLTGMQPASDGTSKMFGYDINQDMNTIRTFMGVCPQHDVLFDSLTVKEHLEFFGRLKKVPAADLPRMVTTAIAEVQLDLETNKESCQLSGGQKRRLSLAIALIGDSRIVFLDEPTSGVDPFSRRAIWDLLARKKEGRVIVLTTHFMDEADQLGDRIGILHGGKMKCCGSALFLKRKFGVGYNMVVTKDRAGCDEEALQKLVVHHVAAADKLSSVGSEVVFRLPLASTAQFPDLLSAMDDNKQRIGVINYGLSVTTLEEVFIKVATNRDEKGNDPKESGDKDKDKGGSDDLLTADPAHGTFCRHFKALFWKRWHITKRDRRQQCCQFLAPLIMLVIGFALLHIPPNADFPSMVMEPSQFDHPNYVSINRAHFPAYFTANIDADTATFDDVTANSLEEFQLGLLSHRLLNQQSRYGAFFRNATSALFGDYSYTVATNISGLHAMPIFQNIANNAILRNLTGNPKASITTRMHPFAWTQSEKKFIEGFNGVFASIVISFAFAFIPAGFAVFIVLERERQCKHLQMISGVSNISYWVANYAWDMLNFMIPAALSAGVVYAYGNENFVGDNFQVICLQFFLYGLAVIPFTYCASFLFASHSTAQNVMILVYVVGGVMLTMVDFALSQIDSTKDANNQYIRHLFRLIPNFCLGDTIFWMSLRSLLRMSKWDLDISGNDSIFLAWEAVAYFILTIAIDYLQNIPSFVALFKADPVVKDTEEQEPLDIDVAEERERVSSGNAHTDNIQVKGLRKTYARGGLPAQVSVKDVWFGIPAGECFGFLGVNGAGKTTTLKMLTGDVIPTAGGALLGGFNIASQPVECRRLMGYCPQFDALHELLTATETLEMYGRIRGIPERNLAYMVSYLVDRLDLKKYANRPAGTYSGGNRRKLSVAIALIGNPKVVFLDEPSTGMDPVARRFMWDFLNETMASRAVVLTTHSMEECEALCNRIGILVAGELKCLGTSQHLKSRFGKGFQIDISTGGNNPEKAREFITREFKSCEEIECYGGKIKYKLHEIPGLTLRSVFDTIERNKVAVGISEYSVGQTTLEQLFINFARKGEEDKHLLAGAGTVGGHQHISVGVAAGGDQKMKALV